MTSIEWTDRVWNPVVGCSRVSKGCEHCYAERVAHRGMTPAHRGLTVMGKHGPRWNGTVRFLPERLDEPLRWRKPARVFVNSMSDLFHESLTDEQIAAVFKVMWTAERHTFQVLTKRPARALDFFRAWGTGKIERQLFGAELPPRNVHLLVSVEDQETADERIPLLLQCPAAVRGVSYEPALGRVDFAPWLFGLYRGAPTLDWVIVGGESGPGARPFDLAWAQSTIDQCRAAGVPCFVKQLGAQPVEALSGDWVSPPRLLLRDRKGGDVSEWPEDLRVREWPEVRS